MSRLLRKLAGWLIAVIAALLRLTCRYRMVDDPRPALRAEGRRYVFAALHAQQAAAAFINDEKKLTAMVSRSGDGDLLVPSLRLRGVIAVRGSTKRDGRDKGGGTALHEMARLLEEQRIPGIITVDGPRGPRGSVAPGIAVVAQRCDAVILPVSAVPSRRWILRGTWDRLQMPKPFSRITMWFGAPIVASAWPDIDLLRAEVGRALEELERRTDPEEAARAAAASEERRRAAST